jgi:hypothetical protein
MLSCMSKFIVFPSTQLLCGYTMRYLSTTCFSISASFSRKQSSRAAVERGRCMNLYRIPKQVPNCKEEEHS